MIEEQNFPYRAFRFLGWVIIYGFWILLALVIIVNVPDALDTIWSLLGL